MNRTAGPFVKLLKVARRGKGSDVIVENPIWDQIQEALLGFDNADVGRVELMNADETVVMGIYGSPGRYHFVIAADETDYHFFWNDKEISEELVEVAWNLYPKNQVCSDAGKMISAAKYFFETGKPSNEVRWIHEEMDE